MTNETRTEGELVEAVTDRIRRLEAALKPFAEANIQAHSHQSDSSFVSFSVAFGYTKHGVTLGDFRRAHDALYPPKLP